MSRIEINLVNLRYNLTKIKEWVSEDVEIMPIVKSEAYGHGMLRCTRELASEGVSWFAVSSIDEAMKIRRQHPNLAILILGLVDSADFGQSLSGDFRLTIDSDKDLNFLDTQARIYGRRARIHIKVNTGMNRFGVEADRAVDLVEKAKTFKNILVEGIYSHFYDSENQKTLLQQWQKFNEVLFDLQKKDLDIPLRHMANSGAIINFDRSFFEIVRPGALLYGLMGRKELGIKPVLSWRAKILKIRRLQPGDCISYGCTFKAKHLTDLAIIDTGYADGYDRGFSNRAEVLVKGKRCKVVGAINMNYSFVDITPAMRVSKKLSPHLGDEVILVGAENKEEITIKDLADLIGTNVHEVISRISWRIPRSYKD